MTDLEIVERRLHYMQRDHPSFVKEIADLELRAEQLRQAVPARKKSPSSATQEEIPGAPPSIKRRRR